MKAKRTPLIFFGALAVLLFAGFWAFADVGQPDVGSGEVAVIDGAPEGLDKVTKDELDRGIKSVSFSSGLQKPPEPGSDTYEEVRNAALDELLQIAWLVSEAEDGGIEISDREISNRLERIKTENFPSEEQFEQFLEESGFTDRDVRLRVKVGLITEAIQSQVNQDAPPVSEEEVDDYYDASKSTQFRQPETRDLRLVRNRDEAKVEAAKAELEQGNTPADWKRIARRFSNDPSSRRNGGLRPGIIEGLLEKPLDAAVFETAPGEIAGPVKSPLGYYVFEVIKVTPARTQPLSEARDQIRTTLSQAHLQAAGQTWRDDFLAKWISRTFCAEEFTTTNCRNHEGTGHPELAPPACYEEDPKGSRPPCQSPVAPATPAVPGSMEPPFVPTPQPWPGSPPDALPTLPGYQLQQGPHPPGSGGAAAPTGLPNVFPGGSSVPVP